MKYVILKTQIVNDVDASKAPMNHMTIKITDKVAENEIFNVVYSSNDDTKVNDFFSMLRLAGKGLPNATLTVA